MFLVSTAYRGNEYIINSENLKISAGKLREQLD